MVQIGYRPILWHVMRYYAHYGYRDFILCLGYRADAIKDYFLHYDEAVSNDFVLTEGGRRVELLGSDIADWRITFADTGLDTTIGERLRRVRHLLGGRGHVPGQLRRHPHRRPARPPGRGVPGQRTATPRSSRSARRTTRSGSSDADESTGASRASSEPLDSDLWINGGYFVLRQEIFDVIEPGEELVEAPFARLIEAGRLHATRYEGFWAPLDTLRELEHLESLTVAGRAPWALWDATDASSAPATSGRRVGPDAVMRAISRGARPADVARPADPRGERPRRRRGDRRRRHHPPARRRASRRVRHLARARRPGRGACRRGAGERAAPPRGRRRAAGRRPRPPGRLPAVPRRGAEGGDRRARRRWIPT